MGGHLLRRKSWWVEVTVVVAYQILKAQQNRHRRSPGSLCRIYDTHADLQSLLNVGSCLLRKTSVTQERLWLRETWRAHGIDGCFRSWKDHAARCAR